MKQWNIETIDFFKLTMKNYRLTFLSLFILLVQNLAFTQATALPYEQDIIGTDVKIKMTPIPAGSFSMGSSDKEKGREKDEGPVKTVKVGAFWMSVYEITYDQYDFFKDGMRDTIKKPDAITRPSPAYIDFTIGMGKQGGFPANSMTQYAALMYCKWLYEKIGVFYRLPTEAEWEYAARAGSTTAYPTGKDAKNLKEYAWFEANSGNKYHKVGELKPNAWGLYDMLGNVAEWCLDEYKEDYFATISENDPTILPTTRHPRTVKGGCFKDKEVELRPANRIKSDPIWNRRDPQIPKSKWWNADSPFVGFRIVKPEKQPTKEEVAAFFLKYLELK
jgi:formylglycine-generating enzyme required for sulfatase activity